MKPIFSLITVAAVGCAFILSDAKANLLLTGNLVGVFRPSTEANTVVTHSTDGNASFRTGAPVAGSFKSGVDFNRQSFSDIGSGDMFSPGMLSYYNGIAKIGTSSGNAVLDLYLELSNPGMSWVHLTTMTFGIDATVNGGSRFVPDSYTTSYTQPTELWIGDEWMKFAINGIPPTLSLAENTWASVGSITLTEGNRASVPEKGSSDLLVGLGLIALAGYSFSRGARVSGPRLLPT